MSHQNTRNYGSRVTVNRFFIFDQNRSSAVICPNHKPAGHQNKLLGAIARIRLSATLARPRYRMVNPRFINSFPSSVALCHFKQSYGRHIEPFDCLAKIKATTA